MATICDTDDVAENRGLCEMRNTRHVCIYSTCIRILACCLRSYSASTPVLIVHLSANRDTSAGDYAECMLLVAFAHYRGEADEELY